MLESTNGSLDACQKVRGCYLSTTSAEGGAGRKVVVPTADETNAAIERDNQARSLIFLLT